MLVKKLAGSSLIISIYLASSLSTVCLGNERDGGSHHSPVSSSDHGRGAARQDGAQSFFNGPYRHVSPSDVGVTIGVGVAGPVPTTPYAGPTTVTVPTMIENVVINGCLRIESDDVSVRNSIINCSGLYPVQVKNGSRNFTIEYSKVTCTSSSKIFYFTSGAPNARVEHNEAIGCQDFFFIQGDLDGVVVKNNYMHTLVGQPEAHADGFQIGESGVATGTISIQGNYFDPDNSEIGKTGLIFGTNYSAVVLDLEDNYFEPWGHYTIRCGSATRCNIFNNVLSQAFDGVVTYITQTSSSEPLTFECNRYADGEFVQEFVDGIDVVLGATHVTTGCPAFDTGMIFADGFELGGTSSWSVTQP